MGLRRPSGDSLELRDAAVLPWGSGRSLRVPPASCRVQTASILCAAQKVGFQVPADQSLEELQWAQLTMKRIIEIMQFNGLIGPRLAEAVLQMSKASVLLEGIVKDAAANAKRRRTDLESTAG
jgi:hypothetical protein